MFFSADAVSDHFCQSMFLCYRVLSMYVLLYISDTLFEY